MEQKKQEIKIRTKEESEWRNSCVLVSKERVDFLVSVSSTFSKTAYCLLLTAYFSWERSERCLS